MIVYDRNNVFLKTIVVIQDVIGNVRCFKEINNWFSTNKEEKYALLNTYIVYILCMYIVPVFHIKYKRYAVHIIYNILETICNKWDYLSIWKFLYYWKSTDYIYVYTHIHVYTYIHRHIYVRTYMYFIYTHTYMHKHTQLQAFAQCPLHILQWIGKGKKGYKKKLSPSANQLVPVFCKKKSFALPEIINAIIKFLNLRSCTTLFVLHHNLRINFFISHAFY